MTEPEQQDKELTFSDIRTKHITYLPTDVPVFSIKHVKRRLIEHLEKNCNRTR